MTLRQLLLAAALASASPCWAGIVAREWSYHAKPPSGMTRVELHFKDVITNSTPVGVLVLCPGMNGDGACLLSDVKWIQFARRNNLLMVGLSFASNVEDLKNGKGYYYAEKGSGNELLKGLKTAKAGGLPLFLYGFSGGAHFTSRFVLWNPQHVRAWCAYSAAWWSAPLIGKEYPFGIVACGERDFRIDPSRAFFEAGRNFGAQWLWIGVREVGHVSSPALEDFFREYVESLLQIGNGHKGVWINVHTGCEEKETFVKRFPCAVGWLPERSLLAGWKRIRGL